MGETVLKSHTFITPSSSPEAIIWSFKNLQRLIGSEWAFFIIWGTCPFASRKPIRLSSPQEAKTILNKFYDSLKGWRYTIWQKIYGCLCFAIRVSHHLNYMRVFILEKKYIYICPVISEHASTSFVGWKHKLQTWSSAKYRGGSITISSLLYEFCCCILIWLLVIYYQTNYNTFIIAFIINFKSIWRVKLNRLRNHLAAVFLGECGTDLSRGVWVADLKDLKFPSESKLFSENLFPRSFFCELFF